MKLCKNTQENCVNDGNLLVVPKSNVEVEQQQRWLGELDIILLHKTRFLLASSGIRTAYQLFSTIKCLELPTSSFIFKLLVYGLSRQRDNSYV